LTVTDPRKRVMEKGGKMKPASECRCVCGKVIVATNSNLKRQKSCGCKKSEAISAAKVLEARHGHTRNHSMTSTYVSWRSMVSRCTNPNAPSFDMYGGRGISVCERWMTFDNFLADMGERPAGTSIDRIDVNGNYEPGNCRWATAVQQQRNRRSTKLTEDSAAEIRAMYASGIDQPTIAKRFGVKRATISAVVRGVIWR